MLSLLLLQELQLQVQGNLIPRASSLTSAKLDTKKWASHTPLFWEFTMFEFQTSYWILTNCYCMTLMILLSSSTAPQNKMTHLPDIGSISHSSPRWESWGSCLKSWCLMNTMKCTRKAEVNAGTLRDKQWALEQFSPCSQVSSLSYNVSLEKRLPVW